MECPFCKIARGELPAEIVYQDKEIVGFKSLHPEAPVHLLFVPKKHLEWKDEFKKEDIALLGKLIKVTKKIASEQKIINSCKFVFNIGKTGHIAHIHLHLLGGWKENTNEQYLKWLLS